MAASAADFVTSAASCLITAYFWDIARRYALRALQARLPPAGAGAFPPVPAALPGQHQVGWALDRLCETDGARWVYDNDELGAIRRDVMTILTHHAASRQAAMAPYGKMLLSRGAK